MVEERRAGDISDREFGYLQAEVHALKLQNLRLEKNQETMDTKLDLLVHAVTEAKGGWKMLMLVGSASATIGVLVTKSITFLKGG